MRFVIAALLLFVPTLALAQALPFTTTARSAILLEADTGKVLFAQEADKRIPTASMSKIMTMLMVFEALEQGRLSLEQTLPVSEKAWRMQGSKMFVKVGERVKVEDLIRGVIIQSGNDACIVLAEALAGTEADFAAAMNVKAKEIGLLNSNFTNATGWPDPEHYSTAADLAKLGLYLQQRYPQYYHYYGERDYTFNNIKQGNRNPLLARVAGADGMKTGHTDEAGYGLVGSAKQNDMRLLMVISGLKNMQERADESARLLEWGFREYAKVTLVAAKQNLAELPVSMGQNKKLAVGVAQTVTAILPRNATKPKLTLLAMQPVAAPIKAGDKIAELQIEQAGLAPQIVPVVALADVPRLGFWGRVGANLQHLLGS